MTSVRHLFRQLSLIRVFFTALGVCTLSSLVILAYLVSSKSSSPSHPSQASSLGPDLLCENDVRQDYTTVDHSDGSSGHKIHTEPRVLVVVETPYTRLGQAVLVILESVRFKHRLDVISPGSDRRILPSLTHGDRGRFSVIVFERLETYLALDSWNRQLLDKYCRDYDVGIVAFAQPDEVLFNAQVKEFPLFIHSKLSVRDYYISSKSSVARIIRTEKTFGGKVPGNSWTVFISNHSTYVPVSHVRLASLQHPTAAATTAELFSELTSMTLTAVILDRGLYDGIRRVLFGSGFEFWLHRVLFLDALSFLSRGRLSQPLDRFVLVDVDDIFVGRSGIRLTPADVEAMLEAQSRLQNYISGFRFNLGFSGKSFHRGSEEENKGDDALIANRNAFWWFGHTFSHTKAHQFASRSAIVDDLLRNQAFARSHDITVNTSYAVAPHHAGVYPVHEDLYEAWPEVWGVKVTSTEEYPHLRPPRYRRGFIHRGIMVLPRQTCGLFTHTIYFDKYPGGHQHLDHSIYGGELFQTILFNQVNIFMTHMSNYGNDRLALYTFENVAKFINCWTNLRIKTRSPVDLADYYFQLYPDETEAVWHNPCDDRRHREIWAKEHTCDRLSLPDFIVIGPQKTGTTALYTFLAMHPAIISNLPSIHTFEEVQFFNGDNYLRGLDWYMAQFPPESIHRSEGQLLFEKSAGYFDSDVAPHRVFALLPRVKLIVILEHPTRRAYSWYQHVRSHDDRTALSHSFFYVVNATSRSARSVKELRRRCLNPGLYAQHLQRWLDYFDISQIHIVDGETLRTNPILVLNQVQKFLGVEPYLDYSELIRFNERKGFYCQISHDNSSKTRYSKEGVKCLGSGKGRHYLPLGPKTEAVLRAYYRQPNIALSKLLLKLGQEVPGWLQNELSDVR